jgi:hypothetical protein
MGIQSKSRLLSSNSLGCSWKHAAERKRSQTENGESIIILGIFFRGIFHEV